MTIRHMKVFLNVYRTENVTKAAEQLYMTQPAVSRCIREIESYYGVRLFERIGRRLSVTEAGHAFYSHALHIVDSFDQMEKGMRNWDEFGILRVGTSITIGNFLLPKVLMTYRESHPGLQVRATISNGQSLQQMLLNNQLDFAVIEGSVQNSLLCTEVIGRDRLVPVLPPEDTRRGSEVPLRQLTGSPLLLRENGSAGRTFLNHLFALHDISAVPVLESVSTQAIVQAVHAGLGVSFLPEQLVGESIRSGFVGTCTVADESLSREHYLVWHRNKFHSGSAREMMDCFRRLAAETEA